MSHVRSDQTAVTHRKSSCRRGRHSYGPASQVGGGIRRQVCVTCGSVTIDVTAAGTEHDSVQLAASPGR